MPISDIFPIPLNAERKREISRSTLQKAYEIIQHKGFTSYGVAAIVATICESIIFDHKQVLPLSTWQEEWGCSLSLPVILGRAGIISTVPLKLDDEERSAIEKSAKGIREIIADTEARLEVTS